MQGEWVRTQSTEMSAERHQHMETERRRWRMQECNWNVVERFYNTEATMVHAFQIVKHDCPIDAPTRNDVVLLNLLHGERTASNPTPTLLGYHFVALLPSAARETRIRSELRIVQATDATELYY